MLPYLPTKFHCPPLPPHAVPRPQLLARLNQGLARRRKLTLVIAPAGFGKTTLVNQWLQPQAEASMVGQGYSASPIVHRFKVAWLALDAADNDLAFFFQCIVTAVQNIFPTSLAESMSLLQALQLPPLAHLATTLLRELAALPAHCLLVLDDYYAIKETAIHQLVTQLLDHLPAQVHLVLLSRTEPPLALARLRVQHQLTELHASDLSFSLTETKAFLAETLGQPLPPETVAALHNQTEGWVAGLQLAMLGWAGSDRAMWLSPQQQTAQLPLTATFTAHNRHVMAYLVEEVLARQPEPIQTFLLRTALLERFCAPLAEALLAQENGAETTAPHHAPKGTAQALLAYLVQTNLFIVPLDTQGEWYRYHQLFRDLLRHHLRVHTSTAVIADLHRRASAWLAGQGWVEEAIRHALAGGDENAAVRLIAERRHDLLNREDFGTLGRWLALFPETLVQQHPVLLLSKAWVLHFQFKLAAILPLLQAAAAHLSDPTRTTADSQLLQAEMDAMWSQHWYWQNEGQRSLVSAQQAFAGIPAAHLYARSAALFYLGPAAQMTGQAALGFQQLRVVLEAEQTRPNTLVTRMLLAMTFMHYFAGELTLARQTAQDLLQVAIPAHLNASIGWAHYLLGIVAYEWNELDTAARHFAALVEERYNFHTLAVHNGWLQLVWLEQGQGRSTQAQQQVDALLRFHYGQGNMTFLTLVQAFRARLALRQADHATAMSWAKTAAFEPRPGPLVQLELPQLTHAKILLADGAPESLAQALVELAQLRQVAQHTHNMIRLIEILAVQALVEAAQGQTEIALSTLQYAVLLAKPGRCIRTFVDLGSPLSRLLYQLAARGIEPAYLGQVLAAFPLNKGTAKRTRPSRQRMQGNLIEALTERELEVLTLLAKHFSNQEIAHTLGISPLTVRTHASNLYQKLGVNTRKQAVARARGLGLVITEQ